MGGSSRSRTARWAWPVAAVGAALLGWRSVTDQERAVRDVPEAAASRRTTTVEELAPPVRLAEVQGARVETERASRPDAPSVRIAVRSACDGRPLRFLPLRVREPGVALDVVTDERGMLPEEVPASTVLILRHGSVSLERRVPDDLEDGVLRVDVAATYVVEPAAGSGWTLGEPELTARFRGTRNFTAPARKVQDAYVIHLSGPELDVLAGGASLSLVGPDRQHRAEVVALPVTCGEHRLVVVPFALGTIEGVVEDEEGVRRNLEVKLFRETGRGKELVTVVEAGPDGLFELAQVAEGAYWLEAQNQWYGDARESVFVRGGATASVVCRLVRPPGGPFHGRVSWSEEVALPVVGNVLLRDRANPLHNYITVLTSDPERPGSSTFTVPHLELGEYRLHAMLGEDVERGEVLLQETVTLADSGGTWFVDPSAVALLQGSFEVVDEETGEPVESFQLYIARGEGESMKATIRGGSDGRATINVAERGLTEVGVLAEGFRYATLDLEQLRRDMDAGVTHELALRRGWSVRVIVLDEEGDEVEGCTVLRDGEVVGRTGPDGTLVVHGAGAGGEVAVRWHERSGLPGSTLVSGFETLQNLTGTVFRVRR